MSLSGQRYGDRTTLKMGLPSNLAHSISTPSHVSSPEAEPSPPAAYAFRLFSQPICCSRPSSSHDAVPIIDIRSPGPEQKDIATTSRRPAEYYFVDEPSLARKDQLLAVAVTGGEIIRRADVTWLGCSLPWRVLHGQNSPRLEASHHRASCSNAISSSSRKRPGKKHRIARRIKNARLRRQREEATVIASLRDDLLRQKKVRKNRAQKLRRKSRVKPDFHQAGD